MSSPLKIADWTAWNPAEYFGDYYRDEVQPDEQAAIRFQVQTLRTHNRPFQNALEFGCGPTLMRAIAAAPYVNRFDMADFLSANLDRVRLWIEQKPARDDWSRFTSWTLQCEGSNEPTREAIERRELATASKIGKLITADARSADLASQFPNAPYDLLVSGFCIDCISQDKNVWKQCLANMLTLLAPSGLLVMAAIEACVAYQVGGQWFPAANVSVANMKSGFLQNGFREPEINLRRVALPEHQAQGYRGIILVAARRSAREVER